MQARAAPSASDLLRFAAARLPDEEPPLGERDGPVEEQREYRQHEDAREYRIDVEGAFGLQDEIADAARGAEVLADHRADEGEAHRIVQAGEDPAHRTRHIHVAQELPLARTEDARVRHDREADFAHTLVHVEKYDEE